MKLDCTRVSIDRLKVRVPAEINAAQFESLMMDHCDEEDEAWLKHGITLQAVNLADAIAKAEREGLQQIKKFLMAVRDECADTAFTPDQYWFY